MERTKEGELSWTDLTARDIDAQSRFYEGLFGWTHEDIPTTEGLPPYRMFSKDGQVVAGGGPITPDMAAVGVPTMWNTYFFTSNADAMLARATELGGQIAMPAMEAMDSGRFAAIQDPVGGHFFVWQPRAFNSAQVFGVPGTLTWADLSARGMEKAVEFYSALFPTWKIDLAQKEPSEYWQIVVDGVPEAGIMPMPPQLPAEIPSNWMIYFGSDDAKATVTRAKELGGSVNMDVTEVPGMLAWAVLADPMGAVFAIMQSLRPM